MFGLSWDGNGRRWLWSCLRGSPLSPRHCSAPGLDWSWSWSWDADRFRSWLRLVYCCWCWLLTPTSRILNGSLGRLMLSRLLSRSRLWLMLSAFCLLWSGLRAPLASVDTIVFLLASCGPLGPFILIAALFLFLILCRLNSVEFLFEASLSVELVN